MDHVFAERVPAAVARGPVVADVEGVCYLAITFSLSGCAKSK